MADFRERNLKITLRFALRFLKVQPRHRGLSPRFAPATGACPRGFMESLIKDVPRKVFLVMDNLKVHHCKPVMAWLEEHKDRIEVFYLPGYSPELNPDERLNADLKHAITTSVPKRTRQGLRKKTEEHMTMVASTPERVKPYFKDKHVRYAADSQ